MDVEVIYIPLLNEGTDVWVPVQAERIIEAHYKIVDLMPEDQDWAFQTGETVLVERKVFANAGAALAAVRRTAK